MEINPSFVPAKVQLAFCIYKTAMMQQSALLLQGAKRMFNDIFSSHPKHADAYSLFAQVIALCRRDYERIEWPLREKSRNKLKLPNGGK
jgi:hypothetical protein